jgi:alkane 1-monooxygenase
VPRRSKTITQFFAIATLTPVALLVLASLKGGFWPITALIYMTTFTYALDMLVKFARSPENPEAEFPAANTLSIALAVAHFALLPIVVYAISHAGYGVLPNLILFAASALFFGQVSNSNAHELIHRRQPVLRYLGMAIYISILFGHHVSAHTKVHHSAVATPNDPNSAPLGMSFYHFLPHAWIGSFKAGLKAETAFLARGSKRSLHPYVVYAAGSLLCISSAAYAGGLSSIVIYLFICLYASAQLLISDYVQHYGLRRKQLPNGKFEPVNAMHSWNSPHWFSAYLMLNAPKHSDHHAHPMTPYVALTTVPDMPMLPRPLPAMATIALFPPFWRKVMDKRVAQVELQRSTTHNHEEHC